MKIEMPQKISVFEDKKTKVKTVALPFKFQDGTNGAIMICRLDKGDWNPTVEIKDITINFNENTTV